MRSLSHQGLVSSLKKIKNGDQLAREELLTAYKPFIWKTANNFCKRALVWGEDDELSIGLIALDTAIDTFDPDRQVPFLPYARSVILNSLRDHFRKEAKHQNEYPLEGQINSDYPSIGEIKTAWDNYRNLTIEDERREEISHFEDLLSSFNISFEDMVEASPRHRDSRQSLFRAAGILAADQGLMQYLWDKKQLPLRELVKKTGIKRKTLERRRKFIIMTALILNRPEEFIYLRSYINFDL